MNPTRLSIGQPFIRLGKLHPFICAAALAALLAPSVARASDPVGIYGFVERVVFEPGEAAPERIQVWGAFALAKPSPGNFDYSIPERGYMYFKLRPGDEAICKKEWADLKSVASTNQIIAFGARHSQPQPTLRKPDAKPEGPDTHPTGLGVTRIQDRGINIERAPFPELRKLMNRPPSAGSRETPAANSERR
jgi:hypothetical protein